MDINVTNKKSYKTHIECLRIIAAFFVIFNHTGAFSYFMTFDTSSIKYWFFLTLSVVCKISVPLFFMISGALLLKKYDESPKILIKRIFRIICALTIFSFLSYLQQINLGNETFNIKRFFTIMIESDWLNVFWYLYAFIAYLITLPFMRILAKHMNNKHYLYLVILQLSFTGIIPIALYLLYQGNHNINPNFSISWILGHYPIYPLIGHYLENRLDIKKVHTKNILLLWLSNIFCIGLICYVTYFNNLQTGAFPQTFLMSLILINCITVYITFKKIWSNYSTGHIGNIINSVGKCTFGIYLLHGLILRAPNISIVYPILRKYVFNHIALTSFTIDILRCIEIMFIGYLVTYILKKIPLLNSKCSIAST